MAETRPEIQPIFVGDKSQTVQYCTTSLFVAIVFSDPSELDGEEEYPVYVKLSSPDLHYSKFNVALKKDTWVIAATTEIDNNGIRTGAQIITFATKDHFMTWRVVPRHEHVDITHIVQAPPDKHVNFTKNNLFRLYTNQVFLQLATEGETLSFLPLFHEKSTRKGNSHECQITSSESIVNLKHPKLETPTDKPYPQNRTLIGTMFVEQVSGVKNEQTHRTLLLYKTRSPENKDDFYIICSALDYALDFDKKTVNVKKYIDIVEDTQPGTFSCTMSTVGISHITTSVNQYGNNMFAYIFSHEGSKMYVTVINCKSLQYKNHFFDFSKTKMSNNSEASNNEILDAKFHTETRKSTVQIASEVCIDIVLQMDEKMATDRIIFAGLNVVENPNPPTLKLMYFCLT